MSLSNRLGEDGHLALADVLLKMSRFVGTNFLVWSQYREDRLRYVLWCEAQTQTLKSVPEILTRLVSLLGSLVK